MIKSFGLLILRISIGTMLIHHGYEKTADIQNFADAFVRPIGLPFPIFSSYIAAYSEIYGSWLLIVGLLTRFGALAIIGTITVAIYHAIVTAGFNIYLLELLILYLVEHSVFFVMVEESLPLTDSLENLELNLTDHTYLLNNELLAL